MTWQQPLPGPDGELRLTEMSHPCVNGCSVWWKVPAAERGDVVDSGTGTTEGNVAQANQEHRSEWFLTPPQPPQRAANQPEEPTPS
ncbi:hypothetical protein FKR81_00020 [Lentzea tibetensis]|uniref:Uncharacterized protein n=1 Tax=Lentzea tibetensis TaxID=2591470 RepID=A0A563F253_9PSEU|nr:hypothetical protein [Lentzea tibetensis]TWP53999.1 hypothetical protein FKR81_00020 [Lentzea tibetensis]